MKKWSFILVLSSLITFSACDEVEDILDQVGLSNTEIIQGLKTALEVSTDTSVTTLNRLNGYLLDESVKILLPPEAGVIFDNLALLPGGQQLVNNTIISINRAAEDAAIEAKPIFINAITNITFDDALGILNGHDSAATSYLHGQTYQSLFQAFSPKIEASLSKPLVGGVSAASTYQSLVNAWNTIANNSFGVLKPIADNTLGAYTTRKALDGLFLKVALEEGKIRNNASHQINATLQKVFGGK